MPEVKVTSLSSSFRKGCRNIYSHEILLPLSFSSIEEISYFNSEDRVGLVGNVRGVAIIRLIYSYLLPYLFLGS